MVEIILKSKNLQTCFWVTVFLNKALPGDFLVIGQGLAARKQGHHGRRQISLKITSKSIIHSLVLMLLSPVFHLHYFLTTEGESMCQYFWLHLDSIIGNWQYFAEFI